MIRTCSRLLGALAAATVIAACSGHGASSALPASNEPFAAIQAPAVPPGCMGQQTTKTHSTVSEKLLTGGGHLCIPAFAGFGGSVAYPPANPSVGITLISSTTNYNGQLPQLHTGSPIFYLQLALSGGTSFGNNVPVGGGLTGAGIKAGHTYTIYGQAKLDGFTFNFTPCYAVATKGKYGGVLGGAGTLLKGQDVPGAATGVLEVYAGKSATGAC